MPPLDRLPLLGLQSGTAKPVGPAYAGRRYADERVAGVRVVGCRGRRDEEPLAWHYSWTPRSWGDSTGSGPGPGEASPSYAWFSPSLAGSASPDTVQPSSRRIRWAGGNAVSTSAGCGGGRWQAGRTFLWLGSW